MSDEEPSQLELLGIMMREQHKSTPWRRCTRSESPDGKCRWLHFTLVQTIDEGTSARDRRIFGRFELCTCLDPLVVLRPRHVGVLHGVLD